MRFVPGKERYAYRFMPLWLALFAAVLLSGTTLRLLLHPRAAAITRRRGPNVAGMVAVGFVAFGGGIVMFCAAGVTDLVNSLNGDEIVTRVLGGNWNEPVQVGSWAVHTAARSSP
jgi:hypothetical protein